MVPAGQGGHPGLAGSGADGCSTWKFLNSATQPYDRPHVDHISSDLQIHLLVVVLRSGTATSKLRAVTHGDYAWKIFISTAFNSTASSTSFTFDSKYRNTGSIGIPSTYGTSPNTRLIV